MVEGGVVAIMDTSKEYIKMCRLAKEIQEGWEPSLIDTVTHNPKYSRKQETGFVEGMSRDFYEKVLKENKDTLISWIYIRWKHSYNSAQAFEQIIWIPRQDQLISLSPYLSKTDIYRAFNVLDSAAQSFPFNSMEKVILAYVMRELYSKEWNGEAWDEYK